MNVIKIVDYEGYEFFVLDDKFAQDGIKVLQENIKRKALKKWPTDELPEIMCTLTKIEMTQAEYEALPTSEMFCS